MAGHCGRLENGKGSRRLFWVQTRLIRQLSFPFHNRSTSQASLIMKGCAEPPLLDEARPHRPKRMYPGNDLRGTQVRRASLIIAWHLTDALSENGSLKRLA
jgi:hypothetical protein